MPRARRPADPLRGLISGQRARLDPIKRGESTVVLAGRVEGNPHGTSQSPTTDMPGKHDNSVDNHFHEATWGRGSAGVAERGSYSPRTSRILAIASGNTSNSD